MINNNWGDFLACVASSEELEAIRRYERTGPFVAQLECMLGRDLAPRKPGRKPKKINN